MPHGLLRPVASRSARPNRFLTALAPADLALLVPHLRPTRLEPGAMLHDSGQRIDHIYFPESGMVSLLATTRDGGSVETAMIGRGGVVGAGAGLGSFSAFGRAIAHWPGTALCMTAPQFHAAAVDSRGIHELVVSCNDALMGQIQQSAACAVLHPADERLCRWLLQALDCAESNTIPLTQETIAQMLGVRRTTVTIAAKLLQSEGVIRYSRGVIQIIDRAALEARTCECYAAVRGLVDGVFPQAAAL
jgi:CRP-like cAMP-binding protein